MKPLGDDSKPILSEHFFSPDHRIECTYPGKIHYDHAIRDSMGDQRFPHFNRFVIIHAAIISTDQYPADLTGLKEFHSSRDPVIEIKIRPTTPQLRRSSQQHSHPICRNCFYLIIQTTFSTMNDNPITQQNRTQQ